MNNTITTLSKIFLISICSIQLASCTKDKEAEATPTPAATGYSVPTTYNFTNVNYSGQTDRLIMLDSIGNYMRKGNAGTLLSATSMKNMYANASNPFNNTALNTSGKQLKNKTYSLDQAYFDGLFDSLAVVSQAGANTGSNGVAGVVTSASDPSKKYLMNTNGVEYAQVVLKQLMGAVFYYQALETYLANLTVDDNTTVVAGQGTAMEHHCDEALGYLGVPIDFPTNKVGIRYWGSYSDKVNAAISCNTPLMNAFLKLRAAISNKDNTTRDAQVTIIRNQWERIAAASAVLELKLAKTNIADDAIRNHYLSEAVGFINGLKYNSTKQITNTQIANAIAALGTNFYTISATNIDNAINEINGVYGFNLSLF